MTPDELIGAFAMIIEDVAGDAVRRRVEHAELTEEQWEEIAARFTTLRAMNKPHVHQHTDACFSPVPETEGKGTYMHCGKVAGDQEVV